MTWIVRRLTPTECERLQGFPDGWTEIDGASDSARYKALGNSMAVPVMRWIGERIAAVDDPADDFYVEQQELAYEQMRMEMDE